jgi:diguanylate cyclase (GGDEF)-like protein
MSAGGRETRRGTVRQRPQLLGLVLAGSLALALATTAGVVLVAREHVSASAVNAALAADRTAVQGFAALHLTERDLTEPVSGVRRAEIGRELDALLAEGGIVSIWLLAADGSPIARASVASEPPLPDASGTNSARLVEDPGGTWLVEDLAITSADGVGIATVRVERDAAPILAGVDLVLRDLGAVLLTATVLFAILLTLMFRAAHQRLGQHTQELIEAARHDPVTGLLSHGAIVERLGHVLEEARRDAGWIIVAMVDIDNFRLLNEAHGHAAGDQVLRSLAAAVRAEAPTGALIGRYGPDEVLIVGPPSCAPQIRPAVERIRERMRDGAVRFGDSELLPVTVSAGIASYPEHAAAVAELLSAATRMLVEAKTGGGDRVRIDAPDDEAASERWKTFDVLSGLVVAIDAKDHYTKAHSEDVSRYARFLAEDVGLDEGFCETVGIAGLLHDVGKICVPDELLRKPAPLTAEEKDVVANHTIVGHLIVQSLPGMDLVAAGVRHHHERWDGIGYPDRLANEQIPRIARIVAVADAFSAMVTTRPYRKALAVDEALRRLLDAAGTQLDPTLVEHFVAALQRLPDGTLPADEVAERNIWRPRLQVA